MKKLIIILVVLISAGVGIALLLDYRHRSEQVDYIAARVDDLDGYVTRRTYPPGGLRTGARQAEALRRLDDELTSISSRGVSDKKSATQHHIDELLESLKRRSPFD